LIFRVGLIPGLLRGLAKVFLYPAHVDGMVNSAKQDGWLFPGIEKEAS
jgi:hypothetical protein